MIWGIFIILTLTGLASARYMVRQSQSHNPLEYYKNQLKELEIDIKRGLVDPESIKSAKLEIERRILKANVKTNNSHLKQHAKSNLPIEVLAAGIISLSAFALYFNFGSPKLPSTPAVRNSFENQHITDGGPTFKEAISKIEGHLVNNPDDVQGWEVLTTSTRAVNDFTKAIHAYNQLIRLQPDNIDWYIKRLEAYISMANGRITPAANLLIKNITEIAPDHPAGQFYQGLAYKQAGNLNDAFQIWQTLLDNSNTNAPWYITLQGQLREIELERGTKRITGPSTSDIEAITNLTPKDQASFINSMIERLKGKLLQNPDNIDGWEILARALVQQGKKEEAIQNIKEALDLVREENKANIRDLLDKLTQNTDF